MIPLPTNWSTVTANDDAIYEFRVVVDVLSNYQITYSLSDVDAGGFTLEHRLFDSWSVGNACAAHLSFTLIDSQNVGILIEGQKCVLQARASYDGTASDWATLGVFYIDSVAVNGDTANVSAYDIMQKLENVSISISDSTTLGDYAALLANHYGITILSDSPLLSELYEKPGEQTSTQTLPPTTQTQLRYLELTAKMSSVGAREIIASAAALAGGNAFVDYDETLKLARLDSSSFNYNPGTISVAAESERRSRDALRATEIMLSNDSAINTGSGYRILANINDNLAIDDSANIYKWNTAELVGKAIFRSSNWNLIEGECIEIDNVEVSPLLGFRDVISYIGQDGYAHTFGVNGFRLQLSGWCVGELSTQIAEQNIELICARNYSPNTGWREPTWLGASQAAGRTAIYGHSSASWNFDIESANSLIVKLPLVFGTSVYRTYRLDGQKITVTFSYYYSTSGNIVRDVSFDAYALPDVYVAQQKGTGASARYNRPFMRFVGEGFPTDINWSMPISAVFSWEQFVYQYQTVTY